jgi:hypothetical protein
MFNGGGWQGAATAVELADVTHWVQTPSTIGPV